MNTPDAQLCLALHNIPHLGDTLLARLFLHYGCAQTIWHSNPAHWVGLGARPEAIHAAGKALKNDTLRLQAQQQCERLAHLNAQVLALTDDHYPPLLRTIYDPPPLLYVRGNARLLSEAQLAVVGSRKASPAGRRAARTLSAGAVRAGLHISSGLALGIDGEAHRAALDSGGATIAVMATGIDTVYPARHRALAEDIASNGVLVTEFAPGCGPDRFRFPRRNRILSGLSLGVLVVEAALRSGSSITAGAALEQGREVFAVPWSMFHEGGKGCLRLLREGAKMVEQLSDIVDELGPLYSLQSELHSTNQLVSALTEAATPDQRCIDVMVGYEAVTVDELVRQSSLPVARVTAALASLELIQRVSRCSGGYIHS
ncbi:UNVERIFIED_CONTAM: hypothetical protein GTU68_058293 [Idotea baltica]|nr:hypothetical protein [Idotea baltica]